MSPITFGAKKPSLAWACMGLGAMTGLASLGGARVAGLPAPPAGPPVQP
jgi:hypothetical protein